MGYPMEIPNAIPRPQQVPVRDPLSRVILAVADWLHELRRRRKTRRQDRPDYYGQGVSPVWPPLRRGDSRLLDCQEIERSLRNTP